jgi:hypothetical protein
MRDSVVPAPLLRATSRDRHIQHGVQAQEGEALRHGVACVDESRIELGKHFTDNLRGLVSREEIAALGLGHLGSEVLDRVDTTDEDVA